MKDLAELRAVPQKWNIYGAGLSDRIGVVYYVNDSEKYLPHSWATGVEMMPEYPLGSLDEAILWIRLMNAGYVEGTSACEDMYREIVGDNDISIRD